jgi:cytochrome oxidase Cu insertion factor (SCO1/SenC/PrrC family)/preprotein translocase subunit SecG
VPGMTSGVTTNDPVLQAAFWSALVRQLGIVVVIFLALLLAYGLLRRRLAAATPATGTAAVPAENTAPAEPRARRILRVSFGILWIVDGILQVQPQMAAGLPEQVVQPAASSSPGWVQALVNAGGTIWSFHPVQAAAAAVWIQAGIGLWMLVAPTGWSSRLAGLGGAAWGLIVWMFGEAFGAIFAPGLSWLSGAPGAVTLYIVAGVLLALPGRAWTGQLSGGGTTPGTPPHPAEGRASVSAGQRLGRLLLAGTGAFWLGMAVLQAWPGRGYWHGGADGTLTSMIDDMAGLAQPGPQARMINGVASFAAANGFWVNLVAVVALAVAGLGLLAGAGFPAGPTRLQAALPARPRLLRVVIPAATALCLIVWILIQDFGIPGGLGTDPNSMVPWVVLLWTGYRAATRLEDFSPERSVATASPVPHSLASAYSVAAIGALGMALVGVVPLAAASLSPHADPLIARSIAGAPYQVNRPAPDFHLVSQSGQPVSLASLRGTVTLLTFLDPRCTDDCPVATELKEASALLGSSAPQVRLVAIAASQRHFGTADIQALTRAQGLDTVPNWLFLTGSAAQLQATWGKYGIFVSHMAPGASSVMTDMVFVIDKDGQIRLEIRDNPGPGTISTRSSFAMLLSDAARQTLNLS